LSGFSNTILSYSNELGITLSSLNIPKAQEISGIERSIANATDDKTVNDDNDVEAVNRDTIQSNSTATSSNHDTRTPWDPRIYAVDALYCTDPNQKLSAWVVPFSTESVATAFSDLVFVGPQQLTDKIAEKLKGTASSEKSSSSKSTTDVETGTANNGSKESSAGEKRVYSYVKNPDDPDYAIDPDVMGMQSLMNPYSITRLAGAIRVAPESGGGLVFGKSSNMLFDIRDNRRFYDFSSQSGASGEDTTADRLAVLDPTTTNIIKYSNNDP